MKSLTQTPFMTRGLSLEMIDFQDHSFHEQLTGLFEAIAKLGRRSMAGSDEAVAIEQAIFDRTGVLIELTLHEGGAYCLPPIMDKNNPLLSNMYREYFQHATPLKLIKKAEEGVIRGTVNLAAAKVSGVFSEIKCVLNMPPSWINGTVAGVRLTPGELSGIALHEIGHLFTGFEYLVHSVTTNQVLSAVARALEQSDDTNEREIIITSAANALKIGSEKLKELATTANGSVAVVKILQETVTNSRSEIGSSIYDENNWEQLADQFASRFGAQRDLITGLAKLHRGSGDMAMRSNGMYVALEIVKIVMAVGSLAIGIVAPVAAMVPVLVWLNLILLDNPGSATYDRTGHRLLRMRDQLVEQLKDRDLDKEFIERVRADLKVVDDLLKTVKDRFSLISMVFNFLSSDRRDRFAQEKLARELEDLVSNDLFVKSAELKILS